MLTDRGERRDAAERRADERGGCVERTGDRDDVAGERVERVVAVGRPRAVAVAAQVDRVRPPPRVAEHAQRGAPRVPGLAAAVQQHHRRIARRARRVGRQPVPVPPEELGLFHDFGLFGHAHVLGRVRAGPRFGFPRFGVGWAAMYRPPRTARCGGQEPLPTSTSPTRPRRPRRRRATCTDAARWEELSHFRALGARLPEERMRLRLLVITLSAALIGVTACQPADRSHAGRRRGGRPHA